MHVLRPRSPEPERLRDGLRRVDELTRTRDHDDTADFTAQRVDRARHLERQLRNAIPELGKCQFLENDIGRAAKGGRSIRPKLGTDERIGRLIFASRVEPRDCPRKIQFPSICPHAPQAGDLTLAQRHRETREVLVFNALCGPALGTHSLPAPAGR